MHRRIEPNQECDAVQVRAVMAKVRCRNSVCERLGGWPPVSSFEAAKPFDEFASNVDTGG